MAALLVKNISMALHRRIRACAARHRRSLTQEILVLLEEALAREEQTPEFPPVFKGTIGLTDAWLKKAKRQGLP